MVFFIYVVFNKYLRIYEKFGIVIKYEKGSYERIFFRFLRNVYRFFIFIILGIEIGKWLVRNIKKGGWERERDRKEKGMGGGDNVLSLRGLRFNW